MINEKKSAVGFSIFLHNNICIEGAHRLSVVFCGFLLDNWLGCWSQTDREIL